MPQARTRQVKCNLEGEFAELLDSISDKHKMSISNYIRMLIINDLVSRSLINTETIARVTSG